MMLESMLAAAWGAQLSPALFQEVDAIVTPTAPISTVVAQMFRLLLTTNIVVSKSPIIQQILCSFTSLKLYNGKHNSKVVDRNFR